MRGPSPLPISMRRVARDESVCLSVVLPADEPMPEHAREVKLVGRIHYRPKGGFPSYLSLDTTASRFHGASVAGLVVGAMGVFVFTVALRHWLGERRATL